MAADRAGRARPRSRVDPVAVREHAAGVGVGALTVAVEAGQGIDGREYAQRNRRCVLVGYLAVDVDLEGNGAVGRQRLADLLVAQAPWRRDAEARQLGRELVACQDGGVALADAVEKVGHAADARIEWHHRPPRVGPALAHHSTARLSSSASDGASTMMTVIMRRAPAGAAATMARGPARSRAGR